MKFIKFLGILVFVVANLLFVSSQKSESNFTLEGLTAKACTTVECDGTKEILCADNYVSKGQTWKCYTPSHNTCEVAC